MLSIRLHIHSLDPDPFAIVPYLSAASGGGATVGELAIVRAQVPALPDGVDAILATGDLQARSRDGRGVLLGEVLAEQMIELAVAGAVPSPERTGVVLAGDLYAAPRADQRGASGCVVPVWEAFACMFRWVVGVLGNHDTLGDAAEQQRFAMLRRAHLLDGTRVTLDGLVVAGVGGICGAAGKPQRRPEDRFCAEVTRVATGADLLVLHESPSGEPGQLGRASIRAAIAPTGVPMVISGHCHWPSPLGAIGTTTQLVNVDSRALLLMR